MGNRATDVAVESAGDSGYIQIFSQFGWVGAGLFFAALYALWSELGRRWNLGIEVTMAQAIDSFVPATRAILLGSLVYLVVGDIFAGFSLLWVFFGRSISPYADPKRLLRFGFLVQQVLEGRQREHTVRIYW